ncbi:MAG: hypothetical protein KJ601_07545 [Nanoarchaeota archaeon]|nr:hypothetical protein [Nanoarchaeota archaeon]MBU1704351.1 hypothetical protein [Nanoarchaeota archaeon]
MELSAEVASVFRIQGMEYYNIESQLCNWDGEPTCYVIMANLLDSMLGMRRRMETGTPLIIYHEEDKVRYTIR